MTIIESKRIINNSIMFTVFRVTIVLYFRNLPEAIILRCFKIDIIVLIDGGCTFYQNALRSVIVPKTKFTFLEGQAQ